MTESAQDASASRHLPDDSLRRSQDRYRGLFENCPVSLWELDYSLAKRQIDRLRADGVTDLSAYFRDHPAAAGALTSSSRVLAVNAATLKLHQAASMEEMMAREHLPFGPDAREPLVEARVALAEGRTPYETQAPATLPGDEKLQVILRWSLLPGHEDTWDRVIVSVTDVTALHQARRELQEAYRKLMSVREEERRRQATELHDSVGQGLVAFKLTLQGALNQCNGKDHEAVLAQLTRLAGQADFLIADVRRICQGLFPATLEALGLPAALKHLADSTRAGGVETELLCRETLFDARFPAEVEIALFRIAQEALTNAVRHGRADRIQISLEFKASKLRLEIRDNGVGFDPDQARRHGLGLGSMDERAQAVGGQLTLRSQPGLTLVSVRLATQPLPPA